jgi:hypothetical protein
MYKADSIQGSQIPQACFVRQRFDFHSDGSCGMDSCYPNRMVLDP